MAARLGRTDRVTYGLGEWPGPGRRLTVDDGVVRLEGFRSQSGGTLTVVGWDRRRLTLLVVPPETGADEAEHVLATTAGPDGGGAHPRTAGAVAGPTPGGVPLPA
ncbi:DUF5994 family protein [Amycolatopsis sp. A133]|uniref:DUF5994 family protein n=1 Tax=Amycolatopsis sp. A133 TaxID=3064472 RepID=UPI0027EE9C35|nr:DUF5994 family protein [Amycolatopsis sp. A133]MDQ7803092.1 DUF5994 family protein [Amycolatopsis sp. A133]